MKIFAENKQVDELDEETIIPYIKNLKDKGYVFSKVGETMFKATNNDVILFRPDHNCEDSMNDFVEFLKTIK